MTERQKALEILLNIYKNKSYSNLELAEKLKGMERREKALVTNIVYGVLQNEIHIDFILSHYLKSPLTKTDITVLAVLRMGVYQIIYTDKIPDYAVVNESIKLVRKSGKSFASGMVNAVLRGILRGDKKIKYPEEKSEYLSVYYSVPKWICDMWLSEYPGEAEAMIKAGNTKPPLTVRANTLKVSAQELARLMDGRRTELCEDGVVLGRAPEIATDELYLKGYYYPQDEASMLAAAVLAPKKGETVIDMCAAPGGKTTYMAQLMENEGKITAFDVYEHKLELIKTTAERLGISIINPALGDGCVLNEKYINTADKILVDAPCSGLGILRRKPEIKYVRTPEDIGELTEIQYKILCNAAEYLSCGGEMVYSTCTVCREENEGMVQKFLETHKNFAPAVSDVIGDTQKQFFTSENSYDGFYIAKFRKISD